MTLERYTASRDRTVIAFLECHKNLQYMYGHLGSSGPAEEWFINAPSSAVSFNFDFTG